MGGHSSGGGDNQVSGYEAEITKQRRQQSNAINTDQKVSTYSSRNIDPKKGKTVNQTIAEQNRINRESRKGFFQKYTENVPLGKLSKSKWSKEGNLKSRKSWMKKQGMDMGKYTDEFIGSEGFKTQLDGMGYADRNKSFNEGSNKTTQLKKGSKTAEAHIAKSMVQPKVDSQMDNSDVKSDMITAKGPTSSEINNDELLLARKRGRKTKTILTSTKGVDSQATLGKKTLLSY